MKKHIVLVLSAIGLWACATPMTQAEDLKPFPEAESGYVRHVIRLPALDNEEDHKLQLIVGKVVEVDCNKHFFGGKWSRETVSGGGYSYYLLTELSGPGSTMMACPEDASRREEFVPVGIEDDIVRYNSKLPVVVYTPEGVIVRYRVWSAGEAVGTAASE
ncbi:MAG: serine protease inhibitor ecotin [Woeseiaceae bacterium]